jgi:hypothetical protein
MTAVVRIMRRRWRAPAFLLVGLALLSAFVEAQRFREGRYPPRFPPEIRTDRGFTFCRLMYERVRVEPSGSGWQTDYPYAETNLMIRLSELTKTDVSFDDRREPIHYTVRATDPGLFDCPFTMASDIGTAGFTDEEVTRLREYLLKGGFLWVDDFWGEAAWAHWKGEISRVLPPGSFPIEEVTPGDPIFSALFQVSKVPQITNIGFWRRVDGTTTSERGAETATPHLRVIRDDHGRVMVLMTHNTDVADSWEREGEDPGFFYQFSPDGYAFGINVLMHALTH